MRMLMSKSNTLIRVCTAVFVALTIVSVPSSASADVIPRKILTGWLPYYSMKTSLPSVVSNADLIREVMPFWYTLKFNGKTNGVVATDLYSPANPSIPISQPLSAIRNAGISIIPTITDGTTKMVLSNLLAKTASRTQVVKTIVDLVVSQNYEGIDLDFEGFAFVDGNTSWTTTQPRWVAFIKELSVALHAQKKILSISTPYLFNPAEKQKGYFVYAWNLIAQDIDRLRIMTYDYSVAKPGPIGPLAWAEKTVQYAISVMPPSKVYIGLAGYGRDWVTSVAGVCPASVSAVVKAGAKAATFVMRDAATLAQSYGATPVYDEVLSEVTFNYQKVYIGQTSAGLATTCTASRTAWYQDARSYASRSALVSKYRLGGVTAWTLGMEDVMASQSIRQAALAIAPDEVSSTLRISNATLKYGEATTVDAQFLLPDKVPVQGLIVHLETQGINESTWREIYVTTTLMDGTISVPLILAKGGSIRARSDGTWERSESISPAIQISVLRKIAISPPSSAPHDSNFTISGVISPHESGAPVYLEKWKAGSWVAQGTPLTTDGDGKFLFTTSEKVRGFVKYRVSLPTSEVMAGVQSEPFTVVIR